MRKMFWCYTAAGVLTAAVLLSASYYACSHPETTIGRCLTTAANASVAMQPATSIVSTIEKTLHHVINPHETATTAGCSEECVPDDPQPIAPEPAVELIDAGVIEMPAHEGEEGPAPIIINEDEPIQRVEEAERRLRPSISTTCRARNRRRGLSMVMPYCTDEEPMSKPTMPYADGQTKQADGSETSDEGVFKAWMKLYQAPDPKSKADAAEEASRSRGRCAGRAEVPGR